MALLGWETETVSPPHEPDVEFELRTALSPYECEEAGALGMERTRAKMIRLMGEAAIDKMADEVRAAQSANGDAPEAKPLAEQTWRDVEAQYDFEWAALQLVRSWGYTLPSGRKAKVDKKHFRMLDRETRDWLYGRTWAAMIPSLDGGIEGN